MWLSGGRGANSTSRDVQELAMGQGARISAAAKTMSVPPTLR